MLITARLILVNCTQDALPGGRFIQSGTRGVCLSAVARPLSNGLAGFRTNKQMTALPPFGYNSYVWNQFEVEGQNLVPLKIQHHRGVTIRLKILDKSDVLILHLC